VTEQLTDRDLMTRYAREGDSAAFETLMRRWDSRVVGYLAKSCGCVDAAEDIRQEVFLRVYRYGKNYDPQYEFSTWLYRIATNALRTWLTTNGNRRRAFSLDEENSAIGEPPDPSSGPCERAAQNESARYLRGAIARIEPEERELLLLRFDLEMNYREIGEVLGMPETTVKSKTYRILERLREMLSQTGGLGLET
jgi:RNA polymerase sigma-70 factor, ECF subfamily